MILRLTTAVNLLMTTAVSAISIALRGTLDGLE